MEAMNEAVVDRRIKQYLRRGWAPVPWGHQPEHVKAALREARMVPKMKSCFENSQRLIIETCGPFTYAEGWVSTARVPFPIQHGWLVDDTTGERIDLTLFVDEVRPLASWTVPRETLLRTIVSRGTYGPADEARFLATHAEAWEAILGPSARGFLDRI